MTKLYGHLWEVEFDDRLAATEVRLQRGPGVSTPESIGTVFRYDTLDGFGRYARRVCANPRTNRSTVPPCDGDLRSTLAAYLAPFRSRVSIGWERERRSPGPSHLQRERPSPAPRGE